MIGKCPNTCANGAAITPSEKAINVTSTEKYKTPNGICNTIYNMESHVCLSVTSAFKRSSHFKPGCANNGRRGMRTPSKASTMRPSSNASPCTESRKRIAKGNPMIKIKNERDSDNPVTAQVK